MGKKKQVIFLLMILNKINQRERESAVRSRVKENCSFERNEGFENHVNFSNRMEGGTGRTGRISKVILASSANARRAVVPSLLQWAVKRPAGMMAVNLSLRLPFSQLPSHLTPMAEVKQPEPWRAPYLKEPE